MTVADADADGVVDSLYAAKTKLIKVKTVSAV